MRFDLYRAGRAVANLWGGPSWPQPPIRRLASLDSQTFKQRAGRNARPPIAAFGAILLATSAFGQQAPLRERLLASAQKGDAEAQFELGKNYETGRIGLPKDLAQAEHWYREAAVQGDPFAEASLGLLYQFGKGLSRDSVQALMWYEVALTHSKGGDRDSIAELRDDVVRNMTAAQIDEARGLARAWKPKPAR